MKRHVLLLSFIIVTLSAVISPVTAYSASTTNPESTQPANNVVHKHKTPGASQETLDTPINKDKRTVLIEDSREMSPFFKLGIGINVVMFLVFGWWFSKEWRRRS